MPRPPSFKEAELPEELRKLTKDELAATMKKLQAERDALKKTALELDKKRMDFITVLTDSKAAILHLINLCKIRTPPRRERACNVHRAMAAMRLSPRPRNGAG